MKELFIATLILNALLIPIFCCLFFIYIKLCKENSSTKNNRTYYTISYFNIMWLSFILLVDNIIRLIDTRKFDTKIQTIQAIFLTYLDKIIIIIISIINLFDFWMKTYKKFYIKHQKKIFWITLVITRLGNIVLTGYFFIISPGITNYKDDNYEGNIYYYHKYIDSKVIVDLWFDLIFGAINLILIIFMLIRNLREECKVLQGESEDNDYCRRSIYYLFLLIINLGLIIESILIIKKKINIKIIDIIYLSTCLIVDLFYAVNEVTKSKLSECFCNKKDKSNDKSPRKTSETEIMQEGELIQNEDE